MTVIDEIAAERTRQIAEEGWTAEHDDEHEIGELAAAGGCYAIAAGGKTYRRDKVPPTGWPWFDDVDVAMRGEYPVWKKVAAWWKPKNRRRDLIRAAALIVAEIERLDRLPPQLPNNHTKGDQS